MISAYHLLSSRMKALRCESTGLRDLLDFDGTIFLDSGGYQALRGYRLTYTPERLARFAKNCGVDYVISLDFPPIRLSSDLKKLAKRNVANYVAMMRVFDRVVPAIHAPIRLAELELNLLEKFPVDYVALGGLVPSLRSAMNLTFRTIEYVHRRIGAKRLHLLGFAAPKAGRQYLRLAYSLDYGGWRTAAATGYLLLPEGYRKVTWRNKLGHAAKPTDEEKRLITKICDDIKLREEDLTTLFWARAIFNAFVATQILKTNF